jgi:hypothetical protein
MAEKKPDLEAQEHREKGIEWGERHKTLDHLINGARKDASHLAFRPDDIKAVNHHLDQAFEHYKQALSGDIEDHVRSGLNHVKQAQDIIHQRPFWQDA